MSYAAIGTGRDAADDSFATIFGALKFHAPLISISARNEPAAGFVLPSHSMDALSTSDEIALPSKPIRVALPPTQGEPS